VWGRKRAWIFLVPRELATPSPQKGLRLLMSCGEVMLSGSEQDDDLCRFVVSQPCTCEHGAQRAKGGWRGREQRSRPFEQRELQAVAVAARLPSNGDRASSRGPIRPWAAAGGCSRLESWPSSLGPSSAAMSVSPAPCHGDRGRVQRQSVHATQSQCQMRPDGGARSTIECPASQGKCVTAPLKRLFAWP
jgi:hypothetical protein